MMIRQCPQCGVPVPPVARFCPACGYPLVVATAPVQASPPGYSITNTHTVGFLVVAVLLSLLWFRVDGVGVFPLGYIGTLLVGWWSQDIDRHSGKPSQFAVVVVLGLVGMFLGFFL